MGRTRSLGCTDVARLWGLSEQLVRWRASTGKIPVVRRRPLRFSPVVAIELRAAMQHKSTRGRKPATTLQEVLS